MSARTARRGAAALLALTVSAGLAAAAPAAGAATGVTPGQSASPAGTHLVRVAPGTTDAVAAEVVRLGGTVVRTLAAVGTLVVELPAGGAGRVGRIEAVLAVTPDAEVELLGKASTTPTTTTTTTTTTAYDPTTDANSMFTISNVTGARKVWTRSSTSPGWTGKGVDVALIDSGVTAVPGLDGTGKVVHGPDLSFESQASDTRSLDTFGHGTHMAGIIAGQDAGVDPTALRRGDTSFLGIAPQARVVSLKVADAYGATDVSQVIAAIDWVVQHRADPGFNIRVLNLSFGTPSGQDYRYDPLAHAAEVAWRSGIVVVVSAGNDGTTTGKLLNPAQDPYVIAVAASNSKGTNGVNDDVIAPFSTRGDGIRNPDLTAPGTSVPSLRVPGSWVDTQYPSAVVGTRFFRGSGTSQSAAVVSGAAAVLLQQRPGLTPDQVKAILMGSAATLPSADLQAQGRGLVKVDNALAASTPTATQDHPVSLGTGSLDAARGGERLVLDGVTLDGERDVFGKPFLAAEHAALAERGSAWVDGSWNGSVWTGRSWAGSVWESVAWAGNTWSGRSWAGRSWASGIWNGRSWASQSWTGTSTTAAGALTGRSWAGRSWASGGWG